MSEFTDLPVLPRLSELLVERSVLIDSTTPLLDVLELMRSKGYTAVVIGEAAKPVGIITERDVVRVATELDGLNAATAKDVMSIPVWVCEQDMPLDAAFIAMQDKGYRHIAVVDEQREFQGIVDEATILEHLPPEHFLAPQQLHALMSPHIVSVDKALPLAQAVSYLAERKISCLLIKDRSEIIGILTERDILSLLREENADWEQPVAAVMTQPVITIEENATVVDAEACMQRCDVRRLVVTDQAGDPVGLVTTHDLLKNLPSRFTNLLRNTLLKRDRELEQRVAMEQVLASIEDAGVMLIDADQVIRFCGKVIAEWSGLQRDPIGCKLSELAVAEDGLPLPTAEDVAQVLNTGVTIKRDLSVHTLEQVRSFEVSLLPTPPDSPGCIWLVREISERVSAYRMLQEEHRLFEQGPVVVFRWRNEDGWPVEYVSENVQQQLGYPAADFYSGRAHYSDFIHPDDLGRVTSEVTTATQSVEVSQFQHQPYRLLNRSGEEHWVYDKTVLIRAEDGSVTHYLGYVLDITQHVRLSARLTEAERRWQFALEGSGDGVWDWDVASGEVFFSSRWKAMLGYADNEIDHHYEEWSSRVHPDDKVRINELMKQHLKGESEYFQFTHRLMAKDGEYRWILSRGKVIARDVEGKVVRVIGTHTDLSEQREEESRLRRRESRFRSLVENTNAIGWEFDLKQGVFTYVSPHSIPMLGYAVEEWTDLDSWVGMIHPEDREEAYLTCTSETQKCQDHTFEYRMLKKDGSAIWVRDVVSVLPDDEGDPSILSGVIIDIDQLKRQSEVLAQERRTLQTILDNAPLGIWFSDREQHMRFVNQPFCDTIAIPQQKLLEAVHYADILPDDLAPQCLDSDAKALAQDAPYHSIEAFQKEGDKRVILEVTKVRLRDSENNVQGLVGLAEDVTEKYEIEEWQRQSAAILESTTEGVILTDRSGVIRAINRAFTDITGYSEEEALGKTTALLRSGRHPEEFYQEMWQSISETGGWRGEIWNRRKNGELYPEWLTISAVKDDQGRVINYVGVFSDITQIKKSQEELEYQARHDMLTSLPNRISFRDRLTHSMQRARRGDTKVGLLFIDLDHFKNINDSLGHEVGDILLSEVAGRLKGSIREIDMVARLGGDEFAVIVEELHDPEQAAYVASKLQQAISKPFKIRGVDLRVNSSVGISIYPEDGEDAGALLRNADTAMYRAKESGRNMYQFYASEMTALAFEHLVIEGQLRQAIEQEQLVLYYQPQMALDGERISGMEALVRWQHPDIGLVPPDRFIPVAEETGLIIQLGEWVLRKACEQGKRWLEQGYGDLIMAVNVSAVQVQRSDMFSTVSRILQETEFPAHLLELEITENFLMGNEEKNIALLSEIRSLGVQLAVDDFGTGYSSLAYLKRLPIQKLKIDQGFVRDLPDDEDDSAIARAVIALGRSMKFTVIAEGVETEEQKRFLVDEQCDQVQGYLLSPPKPAEKLEAWLADFLKN